MYFECGTCYKAYSRQHFVKLLHVCLCFRPDLPHVLHITESEAVAPCQDTA